MVDLVVVREHKGSVTYMGYLGETDDIGMAIKFKKKQEAYRRVKALNSINSGGKWVARNYDKMEERYLFNIDRDFS